MGISIKSLINVIERIRRNYLFLDVLGGVLALVLVTAAGLPCQISDARLQAWLAAQGRVYAPEAYSPSPHAHSLYVNTLVERGALGLGALLALLAAWAWALARKRPDFAAAGAALTLWCASFSGLVVTAGIGLVNTTLHHEHAMLALLSLTLWLGSRHE